MNNKSAEFGLVDVLDKVQTKVKQDINCVKVGVVKEFYPDTQSVSVEIAVSKIVDIDSSGVKTIRKFPLLVEVPIMVLGGLSSFIQVPVEINSPCILLFSDDDLDNWIVNGGATPDSTRKHDLSDAVAIIGIKNEIQERAGYDGEGFKIFFDSSNFISLTAEGITLNGVTEVADETTFNGDTILNGAVKPDGLEGVSQTLIITDTTAAGLIQTTTITITKGIITNVVQAP